MTSQQIGDLISREETLTAFSDYVASGMSMNDFGALWDIVAKMPPANSWIPVSKRLPEKSGRYLAYIVNKFDTKCQYIMTCEYIANDDNLCWFPDDECASDNVVAWMPLPEPFLLWKCEHCGKVIPYMSYFCNECAEKLFGEAPKPFDPPAGSEDKE